jgi:hypothetical protein
MPAGRPGGRPEEAGTDMPVRPLPQVIAVCVSTCAIALASVAVAAADPTPQVPNGNATPGTDVAAPDQQNPIPAPEKPIPASAPTWPENPQPLPPPQPSSSSDAGFQRDDAGIGAGGALVVALTGFGAVAIVRRRHTGALPA